MKDDKFEICSEDGVAIARFFEEPTLEDVLRAIDEFDPESVLRLWDVSVGLSLSSEELQRVAEHGKSRGFGPGRVAFVAPRDLGFGLLRQYEVYREAEGQELRVFRNAGDALAWLREGDPGGD
jgi:hypothetical protein